MTVHTNVLAVAGVVVTSLGLLLLSQHPAARQALLRIAANTQVQKALYEAIAAPLLRSAGAPMLPPSANG